MFTYVAAVATAATLLISPMLVRDSDTSKKSSTAIKWTAPVSGARTSVSISSVISLSGNETLYFLSEVEQRLLKKALLRSAKIVHPGEHIA